MINAPHKDERSGRQLIDTNVYLASLVSDPSIVDPMLDTLRAVTAHLEGDATTLTDSERQELLKLEDSLREFLIHNDPIRSFTPESLDEQIAMHFGKTKPHSHRALFVSLGLLGVIYLVGVLVASGDILTRFLLPSPLLAAYLNGAVAWLFLLARKDFVLPVRKVYVYFCAAPLFGTLGAVQFPFIFAFPEIANLGPFKYIGFMVPFPIMCGLFYAGARLYAKHLGLQKYFWTPARVVGIAVLVSTILVILPHRADITDGFFFDLSIVSIGLSGLFSIVAANLSLKVSHKLTARYAEVMKFFGVSLLFLAGSCAFAVVFLFSVGETSSGELAISSLPFLISGVLQLISAYSFKKNRA